MLTTTRTDDDKGKIDRRTALKRMAAAGGALWIVPAVQTVSMSRAWALGSPGEVCYTIKLDPGCEAPSEHTNLAQAYRCLFAFDPDIIVTDQPESEACSRVTGPTMNGNWMVTLDPGCHLEAGFSKCGSGTGSCGQSPTPPGSTGTIVFTPCPNGAEISHVEFTICCQDV